MYGSAILELLHDITLPVELAIVKCQVHKSEVHPVLCVTITETPDKAGKRATFGPHAPWVW